MVYTIQLDEDYFGEGVQHWLNDNRIYEEKLDDAPPSRNNVTIRVQFRNHHVLSFVCNLHPKKDYEEGYVNSTTVSNAKVETN